VLTASSLTVLSVTIQSETLVIQNKLQPNDIMNDETISS